jgi:hypothetical protein
MGRRIRTLPKPQQPIQEGRLERVTGDIGGLLPDAIVSDPPVAKRRLAGQHIGIDHSTMPEGIGIVAPAPIAGL